MASCSSQQDQTESQGCYTLELDKALGDLITLQFTWDLHTTAEGYSEGRWQGGLWLWRDPIAGEWVNYPASSALPEETRDHTDCNDPNFTDKNCFITFSGSGGSSTLEFPASMAGYRYEIYGHDLLWANDREGSLISGASPGTDTFLWIHKNYSWKNLKGKRKTTRLCPPKNKRKTRCSFYASAELNTDPGRDWPVTPTQ